MTPDSIEMPVNGSSDGGGESRPIGEELQAIGEVVRDLQRDADAMAREWIAPNPYAALAVAAGVGYVLGGGLPHLLVRRALRLGGRLAIDLLAARALSSGAVEAAEIP